MKNTTRVVIIGGGFVGLTAAKKLGNIKGVEVIVIDRNNYHLFQPLLYQVATAALTSAEIAVPLRTILSKYQNIQILQGEALDLDPINRTVHTKIGIFGYDYLIIACGSQHTYFENEKWEPYAPGLKTLEQAEEIRRRVLSAFENAEAETNPERVTQHLTFIVVGGGPTGVEIAGAIGELSRFTLARDFKSIDPTLSRIILIEAESRILPTFSASLSQKAARDLEKLGVEIWTSRRVTHIDETGIELDEEKIPASTVIWAAGVRASGIRMPLSIRTDLQKRIIVEQDLSLNGHPEIFVAGDQAYFPDESGKPLPGLAPVAKQQGEFLARLIKREINGKPRERFHYKNRGQLATIGRSRAILEYGRFRCSGFIAWVLWAVVHIYFIIGFQNRLFIMVRWAAAYLSFHKGARLVVNKTWRFYGNEICRDESLESRSQN